MDTNSTPHVNSKQESTSSSSNSRLEMHVLGAGKGESIILRLPDTENGKTRWGVVDCYARHLKDPDSNPTLRFLRQAGVSELEFLCLTHPHDDHFRGMSHLLEHLTVHRFWRFNFPQDLVSSLVTALITTALGEEKEEQKSSARNLANIFQLVKDKKIPIDLLMAKQQLYPPVLSTRDSDDLRIYAIGPAGVDVDTFAGKLKNWCDQRPRRKILPKINANEISGALLLIYGNTHLILGGDAETSNWNHALKTCSSADLAANAVKVSHHGSVNGYCEGLWATFCAVEKEKLPFAVIVPYRAQDLPNKQAVDHIVSHTPHVFTTCRPSIAYSNWAETNNNASMRWNEDHYSIERLEYIPFSSFNYVRYIKDEQLGIVSISFDANGNVYGPKLVGQARHLLKTEDS